MAYDDSLAGRGAVDCDIHAVLPGLKSLLPYFEPQWRDTIMQRGIPEIDTNAYPNNSPLTIRPEWRASNAPFHAVPLEQLASQALDGTDVEFAICNCLYGFQMLNSEDMGRAFARSINDWMKAEWLDRDPRLRASIAVPMQNPAMSVEEIDRCAPDRRFVQVLMLAMGDMPLGKRYYWPIYEAAERHGLPVAVHAGSMYRHPITGIGWPTYHVQDYASQSTAMQTQLTSLICEGVFQKFPDLKIVMSESGFTWLPPYLWRLDKYWHGLRMEVPWLTVSPIEVVRSNVRFTLQPVDAPPDPAQLERLFDHLDCDDLILYSTDYPHWQFDRDPIPEGFPASLISKIKIDNPHATYRRLSEGGRQ
ncbi:amidohydrolase family protein [Paralimibaculum aggregatum]|uniref:Amidohydrolase family protein n=1 Tax=Paralimibaculum aggregatum TaxID=3036245 RepID=A0ABQ6LS54_9RHOB|nr:amidohydrolase family protein [Limibaculum sp. NKW23]GMG84824.1 amidohydrolase family protein [Limibaculum sp. NKW23]